MVSITRLWTCSVLLFILAALIVAQSGKEATEDYEVEKSEEQTTRSTRHTTRSKRRNSTTKATTRRTTVTTTAAKHRLAVVNEANVEEVIPPEHREEPKLVPIPPEEDRPFPPFIPDPIPTEEPRTSSTSTKKPTKTSSVEDERENTNKTAPFEMLKDSVRTDIGQLSYEVRDRSVGIPDHVEKLYPPRNVEDAKEAQLRISARNKIPKPPGVGPTFLEAFPVEKNDEEVVIGGGAPKVTARKHTTTAAPIANEENAEEDKEVTQGGFHILTGIPDDAAAVEEVATTKRRGSKKTSTKAPRHKTTPAPGDEESQTEGFYVLTGIPKDDGAQPAVAVATTGNPPSLPVTVTEENNPTEPVTERVRHVVTTADVNVLITAGPVANKKPKKHPITTQESVAETEQPAGFHILTGIPEEIADSENLEESTPSALTTKKKKNKKLSTDESNTVATTISSSIAIVSTSSKITKPTTLIVTTSQEDASNENSKEQSGEPDALSVAPITNFVLPETVSTTSSQKLHTGSMKRRKSGSPKSPSGVTAPLPNDEGSELKATDESFRHAVNLKFNEILKNLSSLGVLSSKDLVSERLLKNISETFADNIANELLVRDSDEPLSQVEGDVIIQRQAAKIISIYSKKSEHIRMDKRQHGSVVNVEHLTDNSEARAFPAASHTLPDESTHSEEITTSQSFVSSPGQTLASSKLKTNRKLHNQTAQPFSSTNNEPNREESGDSGSSDTSLSHFAGSYVHSTKKMDNLATELPGQTGSSETSDEQLESSGSPPTLNHEETLITARSKKVTSTLKISRFSKKPLSAVGAENPATQFVDPNGEQTDKQSTIAQHLVTGERFENVAISVTGGSGSGSGSSEITDSESSANKSNTASSSVDGRSKTGEPEFAFPDPKKTESTKTSGSQEQSFSATTPRPNKSIGVSKRKNKGFSDITEGTTIAAEEHLTELTNDTPEPSIIAQLFGKKVNKTVPIAHFQAGSRISTASPNKEHFVTGQSNDEDVTEVAKKSNERKDSPGLDKVATHFISRAPLSLVTRPTTEPTEDKGNEETSREELETKAFAARFPDPPEWHYTDSAPLVAKNISQLGDVQNKSQTKPFDSRETSDDYVTEVTSSHESENETVVGSLYKATGQPRSSSEILGKSRGTFFTNFPITAESIIFITENSTGTSSSSSISYSSSVNQSVPAHSSIQITQKPVSGSNSESALEEFIRLHQAAGGNSTEVEEESASGDENITSSEVVAVEHFQTGTPRTFVSNTSLSFEIITIDNYTGLYPTESGAFLQTESGFNHGLSTSSSSPLSGASTLTAGSASSLSSDSSSATNVSEVTHVFNPFHVNIEPVSNSTIAASSSAAFSIPTVKSLSENSSAEPSPSTSTTNVGLASNFTNVVPIILPGQQPSSATNESSAVPEPNYSKSTLSETSTRPTEPAGLNPTESTVGSSNASAVPEPNASRAPERETVAPKSGTEGSAVPEPEPTKSTTTISSKSPGSSEVTSPRSPANTAMIAWTFKFNDLEFDTALNDKNSWQYKQMLEKIEQPIDKVFRDVLKDKYISSTIKRFSAGSVVVNGETEVSEKVEDIAKVEEDLRRTLRSQNYAIGGSAVDPASIKVQALGLQADTKASPPAVVSTAPAGSAGVPGYVIGIIVAVIILVLIIVGAALYLRHYRNQQSRENNYMPNEEGANGAAKTWQQQPPKTNGRDPYAGVNVYEMNDAPGNGSAAHVNAAYQGDRGSNGYKAPSDDHEPVDLYFGEEVSSRH